MELTFDEEAYPISPVSQRLYTFPDPKSASSEGLLAYGGDLSPRRLLAAYSKGIFPWYSEGDPILWWSPDPRMLLYPNAFRTSKSFARTLRSGKFQVTFDTVFQEVIQYCSWVPRAGQSGTWLNQEMQEAYIALHDRGFAHSVEVWKGGTLVGGLYGIAMGKIFFGESMFSLLSDTSKVAFRALSDVLGAKGYDFIDCQMKTEHLSRLGAVEVARDSYLCQLERSLMRPGDIGKWHDFHWNYEEE